MSQLISILLIHQQISLIGKKINEQIKIPSSVGITILGHSVHQLQSRKTVKNVVWFKACVRLSYLSIDHMWLKVNEPLPSLPSASSSNDIFQKINKLICLIKCAKTTNSNNLIFLTAIECLEWNPIWWKRWKSCPCNHWLPNISDSVLNKNKTKLPS